jgi:hypothetical protein
LLETRHQFCVVGQTGESDERYGMRQQDEGGQGEVITPVQNRIAVPPRFA